MFVYLTILLMLYEKVTSKLEQEPPILDKPDCAVTQSEDDDFILLTCEASANPEKVDFVWQRGGNDTVVTVGREHFSVDGLTSTLRLELDAASFGTYFWDALIREMFHLF